MTRRAIATAALAVLALPPLLAQGPSLETILIKNRPAEDLVPAVQPLVGEGGSVTAFGGRLIVKASARALREIKELVAQLDVVPRSFWITVRQSREADASERAVGVGAAVETSPETVETRQGGRVETRTTRTRVTGAFAQGSSSEQAQDVQQLRAVEGRPSFIRTGRALPVPQAVGSTYVEAESGFYVIPRVSGDFVTLEISTRGDRIDDGGRIDRQQLRSTVSGRLGDWISLGGVDRSQTSVESSTLSRTDFRAADLRRVTLKVEEVR